MTTTLGNVWPARSDAQTVPVIRWGIVGTGSIASSMATVINAVPHARLAAVSSRRLASAEAFANANGAKLAFDDWAAMVGSGDVDAVYVATPTSVRETISIAAAEHRKHVLAEKPFASEASLQRIIAACRAHDVGFMDGNHFGHHPRTAAVRNSLQEQVGTLSSLTSTFQFPLTDRGNIRFRPSLEPMGAIGDVGWYCMRAIAEYLPQDVAIAAVSAHLRRDEATGTAMAGAGVMLFANGVTSTFNCAYDAGAVFTTLRLTGDKGVIAMTDFPANNPDGSADYVRHHGGFGAVEAEQIRVASTLTSRELMFEDFAVMTGDDALRERSATDSIRTQRLLDAFWQSAVDNEAAAVAE
ncbi:MAG: Gfo/Idh/MocA family oxidoreductase [Pseudomonadota bacterium]